MLISAPYAELAANFAWNVPERFNIGRAVATAFASVEPERVALIEAAPAGPPRLVSYGELERRSNALANAFEARGLGPGDRIAVLLPQMRQVAIAHAAIYKMGAIAVPLASLFGVDAIAYRLRDSGASAIVSDAAGLEKLAAMPELPPRLRLVVSVDGPCAGAEGFDALISAARDRYEARDTRADDPAMMIYTSGTTGQPKGALHAHRVLLGHLPGAQMAHEFLPQPGDRMWTPSDWAWAGGLLNILLPGLYLGVPVVARRFEKFDPDEAFALIAGAGVRNAFVPPTALRMMRAVPHPRARHKLDLRTLASGGEALGVSTAEWGRAELGLSINEFYGQTECNLVLSSCAAIGVAREGAIGKAVPGHRVGVIDADGAELPPGAAGQIAVLRPDPVMFLGYWSQPEATAAKFIGDWLITGDQGYRDEDGYVFFGGRDDDVITSSGYRIGPGEIEDCLLRHPAVALAAAVGKPDSLRTEIVQAFIVLKPGFAPDPALAEAIKAFVRTRLSAHEYPREIAFVEDLPMTTSGKIIRRLLRARADA